MLRSALCFIVCLLPAIHPAFAQDKKIIATTRLSIEGKVKHPLTITPDELNHFKTITKDSIVVYNHLMERKKVIRQVTGITLNTLIRQAEIDEANPKLLSEYYITCIAADGYKVVFSWNELFNTAAGEQVMLITAEGDKPLNSLPDRIALITPGDQATGRRYVKGLSQVIISQVK